MNARGTALAEAAAAAAVASLFLAGAASVWIESARTAASVGAREKSLTVARNALEFARAAPCSVAFECPQGMDCSVVRRPAPTPSTLHVRATVQATSAGALRRDAGAAARKRDTAPPSLIRLATVVAKGDLCP